MSPVPELTVGVDGSPSSRAAVDWAARRASRLGLGLNLVHVMPDYLVWPGHRQYDDVRQILGDLLASEADRARGLAPAAPVRTSLSSGEPAPVLAECSARSALVVVGTDRDPDVHGEMFGVVNLQIATIARCPVAVVPVHGSAGNAGVVVGIDGSAAAKVAAAFAAREADSTGQALTVLYAPKPAHGWLRESGVGAALEAEVEPGQRKVLADAVAQLRATHPGMRIHAAFIKDANPAQALLDASKDALLLVLGSPGTVSVAHVAVGSVTQHVLMDAACPVVMTRPA